ncbi:MAG TPA: DUF3857 domain-containing protein [Mucilaginibacter sp.]|nr:DUF3857 domain-containing protein [Mucilaginibacter sp.]
MNKIFILLLLLCCVTVAKAQVRGFGNIDTADLKLTSCDFEKDANAMVLFDRAKVTFSIYGTLNLERHRRIKIFNEKGKEHGNIKIQYDNMYGVDHIYQIEAQTINLENGKIVTSRIDPKLMYAEHTDKNKDAIVLAFPNVKPGSVVEYRYYLTRNIASNFPAWYFQSDIPTRYSEFDVFFSSSLHFNVLTRISKPFLKDTLLNGGHVWASSNLSSSREEAYMRSTGDALDNVSLLLTSVDSFDGKNIKLDDTWATTGKKLVNQKDYYKELDQHLSGEDTLLKRASTFKNNDERIAYIFNAVRNTISWNGYQNWGSKDGIRNAWKKRVGNSAEINAVLYHLLKASGIKAYPMLVSTRENGLLEPDFVDVFQINGLVTYVPIDSAKYYVLDATNHYNTYSQIPFDLLNSYGLRLDKTGDKYDMLFLETKAPSKEIVMINGDIGSDAKMHGTGDIVSYGYDRTAKLEIFKTTEKKKYEEFLSEGDNNLKLSDLKSENVEVDTLPLKQSFAFTYDLNNTDNYLLFSPNIFTTIHINPFLSEERTSSIDFGYTNDHVIFGTYKIPQGYKVESLPKDANMIIADKSIRFKRMLEQADGNIQLKYEISIHRTRFLKSEYPDIHEFYKKMYDLLNEPIVLKKS